MPTDEEKENFTGIGTYDTIDRQYIGDYVKGKEHGIGLYGSRVNGANYEQCYVGEFHNDKVKGMGIKSYSNTELYCGEYKNNKRNGIGYWRLPTGASFIGEHKNHIIDGLGILITWEGLKFIGKVYKWHATEAGQWYDQNDQPIVLKLVSKRSNLSDWANPNVKIGYAANGDKYAGEYKNNRFHGKGVLIQPNGSKYEGEFENDYFSGRGTYTEFSGNKFVGQWKSGDMYGPGRHYHDGTWDLYTDEDKILEAEYLDAFIDTKATCNPSKKSTGDFIDAKALKNRYKY